METWYLLIIVTVNTINGAGATSQRLEFASAEACQQAKAEVLEASPSGWTSVKEIAAVCLKDR